MGGAEPPAAPMGSSGHSSWRVWRGGDGSVDQMVSGRVRVWNAPPRAGANLFDASNRGTFPPSPAQAWRPPRARTSTDIATQASARLHHIVLRAPPAISWAPSLATWNRHPPLHGMCSVFKRHSGRFKLHAAIVEGELRPARLCDACATWHGCLAAPCIVACPLRAPREGAQRGPHAPRAHGRAFVPVAPCSRAPAGDIQCLAEVARTSSADLVNEYDDEGQTPL